MTGPDQLLAAQRRAVQELGALRAEIDAVEAYYKAQGLFGVPQAGEIDYSQVIKLDLGSVAPSLAGPKRPQDRIEIGQVAAQFGTLFAAPPERNGFNQPADKLAQTYRTDSGIEVKNGDVLIAAITSCTNTSNPGVLLAAGVGLFGLSRNLQADAGMFFTVFGVLALAGVLFVDVLQGMIIGVVASLVFLVIHLMIAGRFRWRPAGAGIPGRLGLAAFDFADGTLLLTEASTRKRARQCCTPSEA